MAESMEEKSGSGEQVPGVSQKEALHRTATLLEAVTEDLALDDEEAQEELDEEEQRVVEVNKIIKKKSIQVAIATLTAR